MKFISTTTSNKTFDRGLKSITGNVRNEWREKEKKRLQEEEA